MAPSEAIDENGNISGIAGDYLDIIAKKLNVKFEWAGSRNWTEALSMVQSGEADILSAAASTRARREYLLFTDIYLNKPNVIF
ncbi:MAG: transporter substrate-binding domain-containing protein, partial [Emcibacteraceae bacterium]|nr:transporter substrate-binding domain-containing protein [Emcibacteraceae bacterium]